MYVEYKHFRRSLLSGVPFTLKVYKHFTLEAKYYRKERPTCPSSPVHHSVPPVNGSL